MFKELLFKLDNPKIFSFLLTKSNSNHGSYCRWWIFLQYTLTGPTASCCGFCIIYYARQTLINVRRHFAPDFYILNFLAIFFFSQNFRIVSTSGRRGAPQTTYVTCQPIREEKDYRLLMSHLFLRVATLSHT
jgi:hypothetical protein